MDMCCGKLYLCDKGVDVAYVDNGKFVSRCGAVGVEWHHKNFVFCHGNNSIISCVGISKFGVVKVLRHGAPTLSPKREVSFFDRTSRTKTKWCHSPSRESV